MKLKIGNSDQTIDRLGFVTPKIRTRLQKVGICSLEDAILHIPARYEDETRLTLIKDLIVGKLSQVEGTILDSKVVYRPRRQLSVKIDDGTGLLILRFFNFYPNQKNALANGNIVRAIGDVRAGLSGKEITHPRFKIIHGSVPLPENLTPIYSTTAGLTQVSLRRVVSRAFSELIIEDT